jgi:uncharacterized protein with gpF-like domain
VAPLVSRGAAHTARLARAAGGARRRPPAHLEPDALRREYQRALIGLVKRLRPALDRALAELRPIVEKASASTERADAGEGPAARAVVARLRQRLAAAITPTDIEALARKFAAQTATWQRVQLAAQTKAALGVDVVASDARLPALVDAWIEANVGLIKNLGDRLAADVEAATLRAVEGGKLWPDLAVELEQRMGFTTERARLIGRDQIGKVYASIEQARQRELGVRRYVWHVVDDERVRGNPAGLYPRAKTSHYVLDGQTFEYANPPLNDAGEPISPGSEILCRCFGEPVWDDILDGLDEESTNTDG